MATGETIRLAAVADIHCSKNSQGTLQPLFAQIAASADILLLCGDLTDYGLPEEAHILAKELTTALHIPTIAVLGNHDFESCKEREVTQILCDAGIHMLDGDAVEVLGVGFAGVKGLAGGFGRGALGLWGEEGIKRFVREAIDEALKLENALARLRTKHRIGVLHYAPIQATVEGEPPQIWPFLGSSRLEEPLTRYTVDAVFHGHAHNGCPEGRIRDTIPVYNVSLALLKKTYPDRPPYRLFELPVKPPFEAAAPERSLSAGAPVP
jgi:Icc-related predicted phosphoesterase